jgi:hypothetical protein
MGDPSFMSIIAELKRRNVVKVAVFYVISAWLILQAGELLFDLLGVPDWTLKMVLGVLMLGFPMVLVFSWIYEMTPEGIKREQEIDRSQSVTPQTGNKINAGISVGLALVIGLMLYQQFGPEDGVDVSETMIAADQLIPPQPPI